MSYLYYDTGTPSGTILLAVEMFDHLSPLALRENESWGGTERKVPLKGPAKHLCLVLLACRSYEKNRGFTGPLWYSRCPVLQY